MAKVGSIFWQLERFGFTSSGSENTCLSTVTSLPKAGTNLLERLVVKTGLYQGLEKNFT